MGCLKLTYSEETTPLKVVYNAVKTNEKSGAGAYRYGFNGKEKDEENRGLNDFGERIYDSKIGRFLSIDPIWQEYPDWGPYLFAGNNPIRYIDIMGAGPGDRVKKARSMTGKSYKQETESKLRTEDTKEALEFMDCAEFVCRVLHADGVTKKVEHKNSHGLKTFLSNEEVFTHSMIPKVGDVAVWEGHVGIVTDVDKDGKFKLTHARGVGKESKENPYFTTSDKYRSGKFHGFYRPKAETPDGKVDDNGAPVEIPATGSQNKNTVQNPLKILKVLVIPFKIMNEVRKAGEKVADDFNKRYKNDKQPPASGGSQ